MPSVDNRVVDMQFNNAEFERKVSTTLQSLDKLHKSLDFDAATKSLQGLSDAGSKFNLGAISTHIENASTKFLAFSTIGITALANITSAAINTGVRLAKSLSLDQVLSGFHEYETNIGSIQTILANTAADNTNLTDVNKALDTLNEYSDKTIYNFGQMTRNIGTFTAAGVNLDTSVQSIKGIANLAAISGSNSEQASNAMYQLSQAISTGSLKLMDWNSVVNAGMGGEVFQKALFESGKAMKTLKDVPVDQTFEEWTKAGNSFRGSLEKGWVTADVLTTTLSGFTGEMSKEQLSAKGFTDQQITDIDKLGKLGVDSATKIRTLTQLIGTVKESVGSGWSASFRTIFGDFNEATDLFTSFNNSLSKIIGTSADSRNALLQGWKDLGGRTLAIQGLKDAFVSLSEILAPIRQAFQDVFPPLTSKRLFELTQTFADLAKKMAPSAETIDNIKRIFTGFFSAIKIGIEIVKGIAKVIGGLFETIGGGTDFLGIIAKFADFITRMREMLVEGGKLNDFFTNLGDVLQNPKKALEFLADKLIIIKDKIVNFFASFGDAGEIHIPGGEAVINTLDRIAQRFDTIKGIYEKFFEIMSHIVDIAEMLFEKIKPIFLKISGFMIDFFKTLGSKIADAFGPGDFDTALDAVNVGLLGGITLLLKKFIKDGFKFSFTGDFGGGLFKQISATFGQLTGVLKSMQTEIKAEALMKIAIAIGILTASVVVLSLINSAALTKALTAMAIGFGQLMASMAVMDKIGSGATGSAKLVGIATAMVVMSGAILVLSLAVRSFGTMDNDELTRGLLGVTASLALMSVVADHFSKNVSGIFVASAGIMLISTALLILSLAVKSFAEMSLDEMGRGLLGIAGGLVAIALGMQLMPANLLITGAGLVLVAVGLNILALAVKSFAEMNWDEIGRGLVAMGGALLAIAAAMHLMPESLPVTAFGLILLSVALNIMAMALERMSSMQGADIAKSIIAIAGALTILAIAANAMSETLLGAIAIGLMAVSLLALAEAMKVLGGMEWGEIGKGLLALAGVFTVIGLASLILASILPALLGLGLAMILIGAGFMLFGAGAMFAAEAIQILALAGKEGNDAIFGFIDGVVERIPEMAKAFAKGLIEFGKAFIEGSGPIIALVGSLIGSILEEFIKLMPKFYELTSKLIENIIKVIRERSPDIIKTGFELLVNFMTGIRDNMGEITTLGAEIIINFLNSLKTKIPDIVQAALTLLTMFIQAITENIDMVIKAGSELIVKIIEGIASKLDDIVSAGGDLVVAWIKGMTDNIEKIVGAVGQLITKFIDAIGSNVQKVIDAGAGLISKIIEGIVGAFGTITDTAAEVIAKFIEGIGDHIQDIINAGGLFILKILAGIGQWMGLITIAAANVITRFIEGIGNNLGRIITRGTDVLVSFLSGLGKDFWRITRAVGQLIVDILHSIQIAIREYAPQIRQEGIGITSAIISGLTFGISDKLKVWADALVDGIKKGIKRGWDAIVPGSPSRVFRAMGENMIDGLIAAFDDDTSMDATMGNYVKNTITAFNKVLSTIPDSLDTMDVLNPTITPVLNLTDLQNDSKKIAGFFEQPNFTPSFDQAREIAYLNQQLRDASVVEPAIPVTTEVKFEQTINAPKALSTADIYRQTRNQILMAKKELSIP